MYRGESIKLRKKAVILGAIAVVLLFVSSATAVPQVHGSVVIEKIDEIEEAKTISDILSKDINIENLGSGKTSIESVFILIAIAEQMVSLVKNQDSKFDMSVIQNAAKQIRKGEVDEKNVISKTQDCLDLLSDTIDKTLTKKGLSNEKVTVFETLKTYLSKMRTLVDDKASNIDTANKQKEGGLLQKLLTIVMMILLIPFMIFKGVIHGILGVTWGIMRGISALVKLVILLFAGVQTALTFTAFLVIFMGVMSKIGIKLFTSAGAPIFAFITFRMIHVFGSLLGGLSLAGHSLVALLIILAIPLALAFILLVLLSKGGGVSSVLAPVLEVIFGILIKIPGLEGVLHSIWDWLGENLQDWPEWPFATQLSLTNAARLF